MDAPRLEFLLLGPLEARRDGTRIELGPRKQRAVLALLLLSANHIVSAERLIDDLWGEAPPDTARSALQVYVAGLRKAFGSGGTPLKTIASGYVMEVAPDALDVAQFETLRAAARTSVDADEKAGLLHEALRLWRDRPLADIASEPFAAEAAGRLEELRLAALEERIDADLALGRHATLVIELDALVAEHPYRERFRGQLMLALYRSGRQADALAAYRAARQASIEGLGLEPGPELRALERSVLEQDPALAPPSAPPDEPTEQPPLRRRWPWALAAPIVVVAAVAGVVALLDHDPPTMTAPPNSVAVVDPSTNRIDAVVSAGVRPGPVAFGAGSVWVGSLEDRTLVRIDPSTRRMLGTVALPATPTGVTFGYGAVWVAHGRLGAVSRVDPEFNRRTHTVDVTGRALYFPDGSIATGEGAVWAAFGNSTLARLEPTRPRTIATTTAGVGPAGVVVAFGYVWVSNSGDSTVGRFNPTTFQEGRLDEKSVGATPQGLAAGEGAVWVANSGDATVTRIDAITGSTRDIQVGAGPAAVAVGVGAVWVANRGDGTVSRIDSATWRVVATIPIGGAPSGIAVADGAVWVTVQAP